MTLKFKDAQSLEKRQRGSEKIRRKYPDRIPVIVEKSNYALKDIPDLDKHKYLIPNSLTGSQFMYVIRKRLKLMPEKALFMFVGEKEYLITPSEIMNTIYEKHCDEDGYLYCTYCGHDSFG